MYGLLFNNVKTEKILMYFLKKIPLPSSPYKLVFIIGKGNNAMGLPEIKEIITLLPL